jgi:Plant transposon protein
MEGLRSFLHGRAPTLAKRVFQMLVLEAMACHNIRFWHAAFGWPGTLNDINICNGSSLHEELTSGRWGTSVDFPFSIGDYSFTKLFVLVNGIYPELSRFVNTFGEPIS